MRQYFYKCFIVTLFIVMSALPVLAQRNYRNTQLKRKYQGVVEVVGGAGVTYYMGDLRQSTFKNLGLGPNIGAGLTYRLLNRVCLRSELRFYNVGGSQVGNTNSNNSLSFRTTSADVYIGAQLELFRYTDKMPLNVYLFGGIGLTYLNPHATLDGKSYSLAPYQTEGIKYSRVVMASPAGLGVMYQLDEQLKIGIEVSSTYVNSDYFDDVSNKYVAFSDQNSIAARLADRKPEFGFAPSQPGDVRGNPTNKDLYIILALKANYTLRSRFGQRNQLKCNNLE